MPSKFQTHVTIPIREIQITENEKLSKNTPRILDSCGIYPAKQSMGPLFPSDCFRV